MEMNEAYRYFQSQLDGFSQDDPTETKFLVNQYSFRVPGRVVFDNDAFLALGSALEKSTHVTLVDFDISDLTSIEGCSTMVEFLKSTKSLRDLSMRCWSKTKMPLELRVKITDRLLEALHQNKSSSLSQLSLLSIDFSSETLSRLLTKPNITLQTLKLSEGALSFETDSSSQSIVGCVGIAIRNCHSLKEIELGKLPKSWIVSILHNGVCNHPSIRRLELNFLDNEEAQDDIALAMHCVLDSLGHQLQRLSLHGSSVTPIFMQSITDGLLSSQYHPSLKSLQMTCCRLKDPIAVRALSKLLSSSSVKLQSLYLHDTIQDPIFLAEILTALHNNTSIRCLDLSSCEVADINTMTLMNQLLVRPNNSISHLSLRVNCFGDGANLLQTCIQTLNTLEYQDYHFNDELVQTLVASPPPRPSGHPNPLQKFSFTGGGITDQGMPHFLSYLQKHATQLKCLTFIHCDFGDAGATSLHHFLQHNNSLEEFGLKEECSWDGDSIVPRLDMLATAMSAHPNLKIFELESIELESKYFPSLFQALQEMIPKCQLIKLKIEASEFDEEDESNFAEEDDQHQRFLESFCKNMTLTDVSLSIDMLVDSRFEPRLKNYTTRNAYFQALLQAETQQIIASRKESFSWDYLGFSDDEEEKYDDVVDCNDRMNCVHGGSTAGIPLGLWPGILEAAQQYPHASMVYQLLTSRLGLDLIDYISSTTSSSSTPDAVPEKSCASSVIM